VSYDPDDTIAAIATAAGGAARGMVRVSGPATLHVVAHCFVKGVRTVFAPGENSSDPFVPMVLSGWLDVRLDDSAAHALPCDLFLWPTNRSYTRQPVAEFHTFGSPPLLRAVLEAVCRAGARLAEPGEFTLRAFLAGRIDLTQAEAVLGVIDAQRADQLDAAVAQLAGNLARPLHQLRDELLMLLAELEAGLDFVEEDVEFITSAKLTQRLAATADQLRAVAVQMSSRLTANSICQVVLVGPPNAGKSSLFNALAERFGAGAATSTAAIVSDQRGTTRDYLTTFVEFEGIRCELVDTAGIETDACRDSPISAAAQSLAEERREQALVCVYCRDATTPNTDSVAMQSADLTVLTKTDLAPHLFGADPSVTATSSVTGQGLDEFCRAVAAKLSTVATASRSGCVAATADRSRDSLRLAEAAIARAAELAAADQGDELVAAEIRGALAELGKVVGAVYTDDLLDRIFSKFCIGK
jgi:tRNA modification GTPase